MKLQFLFLIALISNTLSIEKIGKNEEKKLYPTDGYIYVYIEQREFNSIKDRDHDDDDDDDHDRDHDDKDDIYLYIEAIGWKLGDYIEIKYTNTIDDSELDRYTYKRERYYDSVKNNDPPATEVAIKTVLVVEFDKGFLSYVFIVK